MLDAALKEQLKQYLARVERPIAITAFPVGADHEQARKSDEMMALLQELAELSPQISVSEGDADSARRPAFTLGRGDEAGRITFAGVPMGHEFSSLVLALLQTGGVPPKADAAMVEQVVALEDELEFEIFVSLSCQNCPEVVQSLNVMASQNPHIRTTMIDGDVYPDEVKQREIMSVPAVFLNGKPFGQGRMNLQDILNKVDTNAVARQAEQLKEKAPYDMLVVGGGPAGAAAAIYAARKGIRTGVVTDRFGGQVLDTMAIENFISVPETEGPKLVAHLEEHVRQYDVDIITGQKAAELIDGQGSLHRVVLESGAELSAKTVLVSTGASWRELGVPGEQQYRGKGVAYCPHCDGPLFKGKNVAVVGGGNSGIEAAIDLAGIVAHVTVIEFDAQLRADAVLQKKLNSLPNVTVITSAQTTEVVGDGHRVSALVYKERDSGDVKEIALDGIFVQIGLLPNSSWLKGSIELSNRGEIIVDAKGQTSIPGVLAAGDVTTAPYKQIIIAMGEGAKASLAAFDYLIRHSIDEDKDDEKSEKASVNAA